jgi:hypothetical protein
MDRIERQPVWPTFTGPHANSRSRPERFSNYTHCGACILSRAMPCSDRAQQRHKIIRKGVALRRDESVSVVTVGTGPTPTGDPTHARLHHRQ